MIVRLCRQPLIWKKNKTLRCITTSSLGKKFIFFLTSQNRIYIMNNGDSSLV